MCGLGFNGYDENGKAKWDRVTNVNILKVEVKLFCFYSEVKCNLTKLTNNECAVSSLSGQWFLTLPGSGFYVPGHYSVVSGPCGSISVVLGEFSPPPPPPPHCSSFPRTELV